MKLIPIILITICLSYQYANSQDITVDYCGGKTPATLTSIGNNDDTYEWFIEEEGHQRLIGNTQIITVLPEDFNKIIVCKRHCICEADYEYTSYVPFREDMVSMNIDTKPVSCNNKTDGFAQINIYDDGNQYEILWSDDGKGFKRDDLKAGLYKITITNDAGCMQTSTLKISAPNPVPLKIKTSPTHCINSSTGSAEIITLASNQNYNLKWSNRQKSNKINNLPAGIYTVTVSNSTSCTIQELEIKDGTGVHVTTEIISDFNGYSISCYNSEDAKVKLNINNGIPPFKITWDDKMIIENTNQRTQFISNQSQGVHQVKIIDAVGCTFFQEVVIEAPSRITSNINVSDYNGFGVRCKGDNNGFIASKPTGGTGNYRYTWHHKDTYISSQPSIKNLNRGKYKLRITDDSGCYLDTTIAIKEPPSLKMNKVVTKIGKNGMIKVQPTGGVGQYTINNKIAKQVTFKREFPIKEEVLIEDDNGCLLDRKVYANKKIASKARKKNKFRKQKGSKYKKKKRKGSSNLKKSKCPNW